MQLTINGKQQSHDVHTAAELLDALNIRRERVALVINDHVIRRAELERAQVNEGDIIEVITMVGGG